MRRTIKSSIKKKIQLYSGFTLKYSRIFFVSLIVVVFALENSAKIYYNKINGCILCKGAVKNESELPPQNRKGLCESDF